MKLTRIDVYAVSLTLSLGPYQSAKGTIETLTSHVVALASDDGALGWGEVCPYGAAYLPALSGAVEPVIAELAPALMGADPREIAAIHARMDRAVMGQAFVKTAIDYACWDLLGKATGLPVSTLLGGALTPHAPLIASIPGGVEPMCAAIRHYQALGYRQFSLHMAAPDPSLFPDYRDAISNLQAAARIVVDANQSWDLLTAVEVARAFEDLPIALEQPCADIEQCAALRRKTGLPIVLDEVILTPEDVVRAAAADAVDAIALKIGRVGGLLKARRICDVADALGIPYWIKDVSGAEIATAATMHLAASRPPARLLGALSCSDLVGEVTGETPVTHADGALQLAGHAPGLGFVPDLRVLGAPIARYE